jgi:hypothetical protein
MLSMIVTPSNKRLQLALQRSFYNVKAGLWGIDHILRLGSACEAAPGVGLVTRAIKADVPPTDVALSVVHAASDTTRRWASGIKGQAPVAVHGRLAVPALARQASGAQVHERDHLADRQRSEVPGKVVQDGGAQPSIHGVHADGVEGNREEGAVRLHIGASVRLNVVDQLHARGAPSSVVRGGRHALSCRWVAHSAARARHLGVIAADAAFRGAKGIGVTVQAALSRALRAL